MTETSATDEAPTVPLSKIADDWTERVVEPALRGTVQDVTYRGRVVCKLMPPAEFERLRAEHPITTEEIKANAARAQRSRISRDCRSGKATLVLDRGNRPVVAFTPADWPTT